MKLNSFSLAALVFVLMFGGIGISTAMNWFETENSKVAATYKDGDFAGQANPADIRGSYSFGDVNKNFGVPLTDLAVAFRLPTGTDVVAFQVKQLEAASAGLPVEVGTASVRMFVAFYKGLPYDLATAGSTYLFPEAVPILKAQNKILSEQAAFLETHLVPNASANSTPEAGKATPTPAATVHVQTQKNVSSSTTFQNLLDWGVSQAAIEKVIGGKMPAAATVIKNYAADKGLEFSTLKTPLQAEIDKTR